MLPCPWLQRSVYNMRRRQKPCLSKRTARAYKRAFRRCALFLHEMREGMRMQLCACEGIHTCTHTYTYTCVRKAFTAGRQISQLCADRRGNERGETKRCMDVVQCSWPKPCSHRMLSSFGSKATLYVACMRNTDSVNRVIPRAMAICLHITAQAENR